MCNFSDEQSLSLADAAVYLILVPLVCVPWMVVIVQRAKLCMDYGVTLYWLHAVIAWLFTTVPHTQRIDWWFIYVLSCTVTVLAAEQLCMRREMEPIATSSIVTTTAARPKSRKSTVPSPARRMDVGSHDVPMILLRQDAQPSTQSSPVLQTVVE